VIARLPTVVVWIALIAAAAAQTISRPTVPSEIKAPAGEEVVLQAHASGSQVYVCRAGTDGKFGWTLKAPEAELHDSQGAIIGRHFGGPTWRDNDGSQVSGKAVAQADSPDQNSIPWLLVTIATHSGNGVLSHVTSVQRVDTKGGLPPPPAECNAAALNREVKSPYSADYYFYAPSGH
jgi:hypothetical protein